MDFDAGPVRNAGDIFLAAEANVALGPTISLLPLTVKDSFRQSLNLVRKYLCFAAAFVPFQKPDDVLGTDHFLLPAILPVIMVRNVQSGRRVLFNKRRF